MIEYEHLRQLKRTIDRLYPLGKECGTGWESDLYYKKLNKNEYFSREDQSVKELGFVCKGILRIFYLSENGEDHNKHFLVENDFVAASIDPDKESISNIQALAATTLICISYPKYLELQDRCKPFNRFFQKLILDYLDQKQEKEMQFLSNTAVDNYRYFQKKFPDLENKMPHYHVASYLGITPTQLSRIRRRIK
ncbi:MAG: Crp/Fnr family transcriptional regulator [Syntrophales bacterium]|nr:Crp/Fnr family transcriptional regulator [Syntrophales bacterium]